MDLIIEFNNNIEKIIIEKLDIKIEIKEAFLFKIDDLEEIKRFYNNLIELINNENSNYQKFGYVNLIKFIKFNDFNFKLFLISSQFPSLYGIIILNPKFLYDNNCKLQNLKKLSEDTFNKLNFNNKINFLICNKQEYIKDPTLVNINLYELVKDQIDLENDFIIMFFNFKETNKKITSVKKKTSVKSKLSNYSFGKTKLSYRNDTNSINKKINKKMVNTIKTDKNKDKKSFKTSLIADINKVSTKKYSSKLNKTNNKLSTTVTSFKRNLYDKLKKNN